MTRALTKCGAQRAGRDLQLQPVERHAIVVADLTLFLDAKDLGEIDAGDRNERRALLLGLHREPRVMRRDIDIANEAVGGLDRDDPGQRQFLHQTVLQRLEHPLRAAARLRRIGRDVFDAQMSERPADLRQTRPIDLAAGLRRVKVMAAAVRIEAQRQAMRPNTSASARKVEAVPSSSTRKAE